MLHKIVNSVLWLVVAFISIVALGALLSPDANTAFTLLILLLSAMMFMPPIQEKIRLKTKKNITLGIYCLVGFLLFIVGSVIGSQSDVADSLSAQQAEKIESESASVGIEDTQSDAISSPVEEEVLLPSHWVYEESKDEMRDSTSYFASNKSLNTVELQFPYSGGTQLSLLLRNDAKYNKDLLFLVNKGQLFCSYQDCHVNIKFDDGDIKKYATNKADGGASEVLFLAKDTSGFVKKLKNAKSVTIEVNFYNHGAEQFKFDVSGLEWSHF